MELNKTKIKNKSRLRNKAQKRSEDEESNADLAVEPRIVLTPVKGRSRSSSILSVETVDTKPGTSGKKQLNRQESMKTDKGESTGDVLSELAEERKELEKFLFEEANKVNKTAIKFILEKWAAMETRLQSPGGKQSSERKVQVRGVEERDCIVRAGRKQEETCAASPVGGTKEKYLSAKREV